ncbi:MAG: DUF4349 domain-containing protein [Deltaproteobacteria bacterium]|nr:DUF4349 domain-containing protein [Deltaproteobacteria bacterium]
MLKEYNGYIAGRESSAYVPQGKLLAKSETRTITLTVKIDAKNFDVFLGKVKEIGSYTSEQIHLEDVTFAYTDLNARLNNQKKVLRRGFSAI